MATRNRLKVTSYQEQARLRMISNDWEPNGYWRYPVMRAEQDQMSVLGGIGDNGGTDPDRFRTVGPLEADFPVS